ncbi:hypothetical protein NQ314_009650 [Rhamnusium bicolor]|uniref:Uncharacterized protein n=1 Tax=Rhamnusium bicolor TaxID=1586634 RepID=A0AAV8XX94_9CUCU|nr:hypothetical protein NQ314_009650 [Rhamnusium bicolor]
MGKSKRKRSRSRSHSRDSDISRRELQKRIKRLETRLERAIQYGYRDKDQKRDDGHTRDRSPRGSTYDRSLKSSASGHNREPSCSYSYKSPSSTPTRDSRELNSPSLSPDRSPRGSTGAYRSDDQTVRGLTPDSNSENIPPENDMLIINNNEVLDEEVLRQLGDDPLAKKGNVFDLHTAVSTRWLHILSVGLDGKVKQELIEKYPSPSNLKELKAPLLNPEVLPVISDYTSKKDKYQIMDQNQLSAGITALGACINTLLENTEDPLKAKLLPLLSDAGRLLVDLHHNISTTRRAFITPSLNKAAKDIIAKKSG